MTVDGHGLNSNLAQLASEARFHAGVSIMTCSHTHTRTQPAAALLEMGDIGKISDDDIASAENTATPLYGDIY